MTQGSDYELQQMSMNELKLTLPPRLQVPSSHAMGLVASPAKPCKTSMQAEQKHNKATLAFFTLATE